MKPTTIIYRLLKGAVAILPFKKEFFSLIKVITIPPKRIRRELKFSGAFKVKLQNHSFRLMNYNYKMFTLENDIFWLGLQGWEPKSVELWIKLCQDSKVIFDVGANTGIYSLIGSALNENSTICAFEPVDRIFNKFQKNISINGFKNIQSYKVALSDENGTATLFDFVGDIPLNATLNSQWHSNNSARVEKKIETKRLDHFIEENKIGRIDLMKIDVELFEPQVLKGMGKYLMQFRPTMLIEIFNEDIWNQIFEITKEANYNIYYIDEKNGARKISGYEKFEGYNFLFCSESVSSKIF